MDVHIFLICDNKGALKWCSTPLNTSLRHHCQPDMDILLQNHAITKHPTVKYSWVKAHQDKKKWDSLDDYISLDLGRDATCNIWWDRLMEVAYSTSVPNADPDPLPAEVWAVYHNPTYHKVSGSLAECIHDKLAFQECTAYLKKRSLLSHHITDIHLSWLQLFLSNLKPISQVTVVKLIHDWAPNSRFIHKQGRYKSPNCPRCKLGQEDTSHILMCTDPEVILNRFKCLLTLLEILKSYHTLIHILASFEYKLCCVLGIPFNRLFAPVTALDIQTKIALLASIRHQTRHQTIIGWDLFIKGYILVNWQAAFMALTTQSSEAPLPHIWTNYLSFEAITLLQDIWKGGNIFLHGTTKQESKLRERMWLSLIPRLWSWSGGWRANQPIFTYHG